MREFAVRISHRPGELARVTNALSLQGVNIRSVSAMTLGHEAILRLIPDDPATARNALREKNISFEESDVVVVLLENRAGELTGIASKLAEAGLNLEALYLVGVADGLIEVAIVADDTKKAKKLLE